MANGLTVNVKMPDVKKIQTDCETAIKRAVDDTKKVAPGRMADAVREKYNIKKKDVTSALKSSGKGTTSVKGIEVANIVLEYEGRTLSPAAGSANMFNLTPKEPPHPVRRYQAKAQIFKGEKKGLGPAVFVADNKHGSYLPFQREGKERLPIKVIRTLSVPQMITSGEIEDKAVQEIQEKLMQSIENRLGRAYEKNGL